MWHGRRGRRAGGAAARRPTASSSCCFLTRGRGYLSKVFNDEWLAHYGFLPESGETQSVGNVLRSKDGALPPLVHTHPNETLAEAIEILREYAVSQMPVVQAEPPVMAAEVAGSVVERDLLDALFAGHANLSDRVGDHMSAALPHVGAGEPCVQRVSALEKADAVVVLDDGKPIGVLTRQDLSASSPPDPTQSRRVGTWWSRTCAEWDAGGYRGGISRSSSSRSRTAKRRCSMCSSKTTPQQERTECVSTPQFGAGEAVRSSSSCASVSEASMSVTCWRRPWYVSSTSP